MQIFVSLMSVMFLLQSTLRAEDTTIAGQVTTPYPTLENISIEWAIQGDDNLNGVVTVRFRLEGYPQWQEALPLRRVPPGSNVGFSWENKHSGSLLNLQPNTNYEIELTLDDPDGGSTIRTLTARTRAVPVASSNAAIRQVTPNNFSSTASTAQPGDILLFSAGDYSGFTISRDGTEDEPVVLRAEEPGTAVVNGDVRLDGRSYVFIEGLIVNGMIKFNNAEGIVVKGCKVNTDNSGIVSMGGGVVNAYIADNVILGPTGWAENTIGTNGDNRGEGIQLTGPGNVICYNYVKGFRDAISTMEDSSAVNQVSIDIYNNDIEVGADDAIEADFTMGNCRIMRNRISNSFVGLSSQPSLGGPTYFIRNVMYNIIYSPFKLHRGSVGDIAFHNTSIKCGDAFAVYTGDTWYQAWFRNNIFIGGIEGSANNCRGNGQVAVLYAPDSTCDFNFDGFGSENTGRFEGTIGNVNFSSFEEMRNNTTEHDAIQVDMSIFSETVAFPSNGPFPEHPIPDLRIHSQSAAVDSGEIIPNVNENYSGTAPDLGAYEAGSILPHYGPRTGTDLNANDESNSPGNGYCFISIATHGPPI